MKKEETKNFVKINLKKFFFSFPERILANTSSFSKYFNQMRLVFNNFNDLIPLYYLLQEEKIDNLYDLIHRNDINRLDGDLRICDKRLKLHHGNEYCGELVNFKWSDETQAIIKTLIGLTRYGYLEDGDLRNDRPELRKRINAIMNNDYVLDQLKIDIQSRISECLISPTKTRKLKPTYYYLELDVYKIYHKTFTLNFFLKS
jgi:hypothetical protein